MKTPKKKTSIDSRLVTSSKASKKTAKSTEPLSRLNYGAAESQRMKEMQSETKKKGPIVSNMTEAQHVIGYKLHPYVHNIKNVLDKLHQLK
jgi:uncharacterized protein YaaR (DUF327 family)